MILEEARHPALETLDNMCFIANDAQFNKVDRTFCIITGPNLGGKSTYLRTVALSKILFFFITHGIICQFLMQTLEYFRIFEFEKIFQTH